MALGPNLVINIYCDESCHLRSDGHESMVLGAIAIPQERTREVAQQLRDLKEAHGLSRSFEAKWTKVSPGKVDFYLALIDAFYSDPDLSFRGLVAHGKSQLRHTDFQQDHDTWYHKMYWEMLRPVIRPPARHRIYIDIKDTRGGAKAATLRDVLARSFHDWFYQVIERIQIVRSDEVEVLQLTDLLVGALGYAARRESGSTAKLSVVRRIEETSRIDLTRSTTLNASKVNVFHWTPRDVPPRESP